MAPDVQALEYDQSQLPLRILELLEQHVALDAQLGLDALPAHGSSLSPDAQVGDEPPLAQPAGKLGRVGVLRVFRREHAGYHRAQHRLGRIGHRNAEHPHRKAVPGGDAPQRRGPVRERADQPDVMAVLERFEERIDARLRGCLARHRRRPRRRGDRHDRGPQHRRRAALDQGREVGKLARLDQRVDHAVGGAVPAHDQQPRPFLGGRVDGLDAASACRCGTGQQQRTQRRGNPVAVRHRPSLASRRAGAKPPRWSTLLGLSSRRRRVF